MLRNPDPIMEAQLAHRQQHGIVVEYVGGQGAIRAHEHEVRVMGRVRSAVCFTEGYSLGDGNAVIPARSASLSEMI